MQVAQVKRRDASLDDIIVYNVDDFPYEKLNSKACKTHSQKRKDTYIYEPSAFDIETTTIESDEPFAYMYHWQMCVAGYVVIGRLWSEWIDFLKKLQAHYKLTNERKLVIYVFNLSFEFQFMRKFLEREFGSLDVFATEKRKILKCCTSSGLEFRCAYRLTNMSLAKATESNPAVVHIKQKDDLDYRLVRTPNTQLSESELGYCILDVLGLYELIKAKLKQDKDNLASIPMTSTGYPRRDCRKSCRTPEYTKWFKSIDLPIEVYTMLKEAGRGGNTHTNRRKAGRVYYECDSYDVVSSYPYQLLVRKFPMTTFRLYTRNVTDMEEFNALLSEYACLFHATFKGLRLKDNISIPYIPVSTLIKYSSDALIDNGRIIEVEVAHICVNDIDWKIIDSQYEWDELYISDMYIAEYDYLPEDLRKQIFIYFQNKCQLKYKIKHCSPEELEDCEYFYSKSKNLLNGIFGMTFTDPVHRDIVYDGDWQDVPFSESDIADKLKKYSKSRNSFLYYAWGSWTTSWARLHLEELINAIGHDNTIYVDTDSNKCLQGDRSKVEELNKEIMKLCEERGAYYDYMGERYYLGIYEKENNQPIKKFKALGAKKYAYEDEKGFHITIAGVNKKKGAIEMGCIENFNLGFIFQDAGGTAAAYNDLDGIDTITIEGCTFESADNIAVIDSTYTLGITHEYAELIGIDTFNL